MNNWVSELMNEYLRLRSGLILKIEDFGMRLYVWLFFNFWVYKKGSNCLIDFFKEIGDWDINGRNLFIKIRLERGVKIIVGGCGVWIEKDSDLW